MSFKQILFLLLLFNFSVIIYDKEEYTAVTAVTASQDTVWEFSLPPPWVVWTWLTIIQDY